MKLLLPFVILGLILIGGGGAVYADTINFDKCGFKQCFEYSPELNEKTPKESTSIHWANDIFLPSGECNFVGSINPINGECTAPAIILDDKNQTALKNNVAVMAVKNIHTTSAPVTSNYCPVAKFVLLGQGDYIPKRIPFNMTGFVYPSYCYGETGPSPFPVPEFKQTASIFVISTIIITLVARLAHKKATKQ